MNAKQLGWMIALFISFAFVLSGCLRTQIIDQIGIVIANGIDQLPKGQILGTSVSYNIDSENKERVKIVVAKAYSNKGLRESLNAASVKPLMSGKLQVMMYGQDLAKKGIHPSIKTLLHDPQIASELLLCIAKGQSYDILTKKYPDIPNIGKYISTLIQHNAKSGFLISPTLQEFSRDYYMIGKDPILPLIEQHQNVVKIKGAALFFDDRMVMTVDLKKLFYLKLLHGPVTNGNQEIILSDKELEPLLINDKHSPKLLIVFTPSKSSRKIMITNPENLNFTIKIMIEGNIVEISDQLLLSDLKARNKLNQLIEQEIEFQIKELIQSMQELRIDPVGFGSKYRAHVRGNNLSDEEWRRLLQKSKVTVDVNLKINYEINFK